MSYTVATMKESMKEIEHYVERLTTSHARLVAGGGPCAPLVPLAGHLHTALRHRSCVLNKVSLAVNCPQRKKGFTCLN